MAKIEIIIEIAVNLRAISSPLGICKKVYMAADNV